MSELIQTGRFYQILQGDVLASLAKLQSDSVDCVVTSPPYWGLRDYKIEPSVWDAVEGCEHEWLAIERSGQSGGMQSDKLATHGTENYQAFGKQTQGFCVKCGAWKGQLGLEPTFQLYVKHIVGIFSEVRRVLKPTGTLFLNLGDTYSASGGAGGDYNAGGLKEGQPTWKQGDSTLPAKCLIGIPERIMLHMLDDDSGDIYELNKAYIITMGRNDTNGRRATKSITEAVVSEEQRQGLGAQIRGGEGLENRQPREGQSTENEILQEASRESATTKTPSLEGGQSSSTNGGTSPLLGQSSEVSMLRGESATILDNRSYERGRVQAQENREVSEHLRLVEDSQLPNGLQSPLYELQSRLGALRYLPTSRRIRKADIPTDLLDCFDIVKHEPWILRNKLVWDKPNHMPSSVKDRFSNGWESIFFFVKQGRYWFDPDAVREPHKDLKDDIRRINEDRIAKTQRRTELYGTSGWGAFGSASRDWKEEEKLGTEIMGFRDPHRAAMLGGLASGNAQNNPNGKNPGDVWEITTQPFKEAHFATFPEAIPERAIKCGCPAEVCVKCGKARENIYKSLRESNMKAKDPLSPKGGQDYDTLHRDGMSEGVLNKTVKIGLSDCGCGAGFRPGIALDPFAGSGTVMKVAKDLGRSSIAIEINPSYIEMLKRRVDFGHNTIDGGIEWIER